MAEGLSMSELAVLNRVHDSIGALRQDVRSLIAAVARLEGIVRPEPSEVDCRVPECNCHVRDWDERSGA